MSTEGTTDEHTELEESRKRDKWRVRVLFGGVGLCMVGLYVGDAISEPMLVFAGTGSFYLGFVGYALISYDTPVPLRDERDEWLAERSARLTLTVHTVILLSSFPPALALDITGTYSAPPEAWGAMFAYCMLFLVSAVCHWYVEQTET